MEYFVNLSTVLAAFLALLISLYSAWISKRSVVTGIISSNRIEWCDYIRKLLFEFLAEYKKEQPDKGTLIDAYTRIALYCNPQEEIQNKLISVMKHGINEGYTDDCYWSIVQGGQQVLYTSWRRMKREAGVTYKREKRNARRYKKENNERATWPVWYADIRK